MPARTGRAATLPAAGPGSRPGPGPGSGPGAGQGDGHGAGRRAGPGSGPGPGTAGWRRWRAPAVLVALILLSGVVIALLTAQPPVTGPLDPGDTGPLGSHALAALLAGRGQTVTKAGTVPAATAQATGPGVTLVVTSPGLIGRGQLAALARVRASVLVVAPDAAALAALAPGVTVAGRAAVRSLPPRCGLWGATLAGAADMGGLALRSGVPGAWRCYPVRSHPGAGSTPTAGGATAGTATAGTATAGGGTVSLVRYRARGRVITVLGTGVPLENQYLARDGNAALAMNLLNTGPRIVWLVPGLNAVAASSGPRPLTSLIPLPAYLVTAELGVALLLTALWRMRRFGPLVTEPLPVTVRASETVEGHARLYRARRARGRAAVALRTATLTRITARLGLPRATLPEVTCAELAARTGREPGEIQAILFGPAPHDDAALVCLAADLDSLEGQVLTT